MIIKAWPDIWTGKGEVVKNLKNFFGQGEKNIRELQFQLKPYIPFESFHPSSNKKAFVKGELMRYARNSSSFKSFSETRDKFWKQLRIRGSFKFSLLLFHDLCYNDRNKWFSWLLNHRSWQGRIMVFKTRLNRSHVCIKSVINNVLPDLDCNVCYRKNCNNT